MRPAAPSAARAKYSSDRDFNTSPVSAGSSDSAARAEPNPRKSVFDLRKEIRMTMKQYALALCIGLVGLGLAGRDQASAFPISGSAVEQAAAARSDITEAQFYGSRTPTV
jgi:hypothetical protein